MVTEKDGKFVTPQGLNAIQLKHKNKKGEDVISYYVPVPEKIKHFRISEDFKDWSLETEMIEYDSLEVVFVAKAINPQGMVKSTGHAHENQKIGFINKTSYIENAETSAVGRCLAYLNIGVIDDIAGYEEMLQVIKSQNNINSVRKTLNKAIDYMTSADIMSVTDVNNILIAEIFDTDILTCDDVYKLNTIIKKLRKKYEEWSK